MDRQEIFDALREVACDVIGDICPDDVSMTDSLKDLGANSVDRMDIIVEVMERFGARIPMVAFADLKNIAGIVDVIASKAPV